MPKTRLPAFGIVVAFLGACSSNASLRTVDVAVTASGPAESGRPAVDDPHSLHAPDNKVPTRVAVWPFESSTKVHGADILSGAYWLRAVQAWDSATEATLARGAVVDVLTRDPLRRYVVMERSRIEPVLAENRQALEREDGPQAALKLGKLLAADYVIVGECVPGVKESEIALSLRLIDVHESGAIQASHTGVCEACTGDRLQALASRLARELVSPVTMFTDDPTGWSNEVLPGAN